MIPRLADKPGMAGQIAAAGSVVLEKNGDAYLIIETSFDRKQDVESITCGNGVTMNMDGPWAVGHGSNSAIQWAAWMDGASALGECLDRPLTMRVEGRDYRLGTKLLREALVNLRSR